MHTPQHHVLTCGQSRYTYVSLKEGARALNCEIERLPYSLRILLENLLRHMKTGDHDEYTDAAARIAAFPRNRQSEGEAPFHPARVLMQDFTGVPAIVDLAALRDAVAERGGRAQDVNPVTPVDLVIDHSLTVDSFADATACDTNTNREFQRNGERYAFLRWSRQAFSNLRIVPPGAGICHQVNLEYLAKVVEKRKDENGAQEQTLAFPDTVVGTDSHTTMVNALGVLGWGVGGIEAEAALLGRPLAIPIPCVVGCRLKGKLPAGTSATELVLTLTERLRRHGVVGAFVEFTGPGLATLSLADRATIANMAPEYGATCAFFPIDAETLRYLTLTGRPDHHTALIKNYAQTQGLWRDDAMTEPAFTDLIELDMKEVEPCLAGPERPHDRTPRAQIPQSYAFFERKALAEKGRNTPQRAEGAKPGDGSVVIAAITSCTNTSNPSVMIAAGLLARNAARLGLKPKPWVKTSLAPGSRVVSDYLEKLGLLQALERLGFAVVGYGCTTCIGNSGPLPKDVADAVTERKLVVASVLSGNRNFSGRIHPLVRANYLAAPPMVVAYALAGDMRFDFATTPLGTAKDGKPVMLRDLWPEPQEIHRAIEKALSKQAFRQRYRNLFEGGDAWNALESAQGATYPWREESTYIRPPPFFDGVTPTPQKLSDITAARILAMFGDSVTTDHISPAGAIGFESPAGRYLRECHVEEDAFNSYGARRGNHDVMLRGTFANPHLANSMAKGHPAATRLAPEGTLTSIYEAAMRYAERKTPLVVFAGEDYGAGSSRDWAAKGTRLLGVRAVIARSFERIHRSNLAGMGVLPLQWPPGIHAQTLELDGSESCDIEGVAKEARPAGTLMLTVHRQGGFAHRVPLLCRLDTGEEARYYRHGGILPYMLRRLLAEA